MGYDTELVDEAKFCATPFTGCHGLKMDMSGATEYWSLELTSFSGLKFNMGECSPSNQPCSSCPTTKILFKPFGNDTHQKQLTDGGCTKFQPTNDWSGALAGQVAAEFAEKKLESAMLTGIPTACKTSFSIEQADTTTTAVAVTTTTVKATPPQATAGTASTASSGGTSGQIASLASQTVQNVNVVMTVTVAT